MEPLGPPASSPHPSRPGSDIDFRPLLSHAGFRCIIPPNSVLGGEPWALRKLQIFGSRCVAGA